METRLCSFCAYGFVYFSFNISLLVNGAFSFGRCHFVFPLPNFFIKESAAECTLNKFARANSLCALLHPLWRRRSDWLLKVSLEFLLSFFACYVLKDLTAQTLTLSHSKQVRKRTRHYNMSAWHRYWYAVSHI